jgi:hypothetical protein
MPKIPPEVTRYPEKEPRDRKLACDIRLAYEADGTWYPLSAKEVKPADNPAADEDELLPEDIAAWALSGGPDD